jgi:hypothetical protein
VFFRCRDGEEDEEDCDDDDGTSGDTQYTLGSSCSTFVAICSTVDHFNRETDIE